MDNGCVCCTVRGDLVKALLNFLDRRHTFDCILLETTGIADPSPIVATFNQVCLMCLMCFWCFACARSRGCVCVCVSLHVSISTPVGPWFQPPPPMKTTTSHACHLPDRTWT